MSKVPPWFERKFDLSFPAELYPNIRVRLMGTPARLEDIVRAQPQEVLTRKPSGKWSAQEHAGHLLDLESLWLARVEDFVRGGEQLTPADLKNRKTKEANHNARSISEILQQFRSAVNAGDAPACAGFETVFQNDAASSTENADADGGSFVFRRGARRSSSCHHPGDA
jgi:DinB superfamily